MQNPLRPKTTFPLTNGPQLAPGRSDVAAIMEALFAVLERHEAGPDEGALALMTSFVQGASRILELSAAEDAEPNRRLLLALLDRARLTIDAWPVGEPSSGVIH